jgi:peptide-methionine (S)-S-oxide reductase
MAVMGNTEIAVFGGGCFWCTEAVFERLRGVVAVMPGYAGGFKENPTYREVGSGSTGHAEVVRVEFDPAAIGFQELLIVFFSTHDPTTLNRQGADVGTEYRSAILYTTPDQKRLSEEIIAELNRSVFTDRPVVTQIAPLERFYPAEDYHREYYRNNPEAPYCQYVITPKMAKLRAKFSDMLKNPESPAAREQLIAGRGKGE